MVARDELIGELHGMVEPSTGRTLGDLGMIADARIDGGRVSVVLRTTSGDYPKKAELSEQIAKKLAPVPGVESVSVEWTTPAPSRAIGPDDPIPGVKNVILVMSGKGGVGKSTVASNLTLALKRRGYRVGLLDADIYGPSIPTMFGVTGQPMTDGEQITPLARFDVKLMSIGFLLEDPKSAVVWRGPMLHGALMQFLKDVAWGDLDYLLLDLPPGTGDVALTIAQRLRTSGAIMVTTPQEVALMDVYKAISMAKKVDIPLLGIVENQSYLLHGGEKIEVYGSGGGQKAADEAGCELLGQVPMDPIVCQWGDAGTPVVQAAPSSEVANAFASIADRLVEVVSARSEEPVDALKIDRSGGKNRRLPVTQ